MYDHFRQNLICSVLSIHKCLCSPVSEIFTCHSCSIWTADFFTCNFLGMFFLIVTHLLLRTVCQTSLSVYHINLYLSPFQSLSLSYPPLPQSTSTSVHPSFSLHSIQHCPSPPLPQSTLVSLFILSTIVPAHLFTTFTTNTVFLNFRPL